MERLNKQKTLSFNGYGGFLPSLSTLLSDHIQLRRAPISKYYAYALSVSGLQVEIIPESLNFSEERLVVQDIIYKVRK